MNEDLEPGECAECHWMLYQHDDQCSQHRAPVVELTAQQRIAKLDAAFASVGMHYDSLSIHTVKTANKDGTHTTWKGGYVT